VALGTWLMCALYRTVFGMSFAGFRRLIKDPAGREQSVREKLLSHAFGRVAPEMIGRWRAGRPGARQRALLLAGLEREWDRLADMVRASRVDGERLTRLFTRAGVPFMPADFGFSAADIREALVAAKEIRPRFSLLGLLDSLCALEGCIRAAL
jgi:glycerol-1-phosphate dehydrogenase [NAD(P)+]